MGQKSLTLVSCIQQHPLFRSLPTHFHIKKEQLQMILWQCACVCVYVNAAVMSPGTRWVQESTWSNEVTVWYISMMHKQSFPPPERSWINLIATWGFTIQSHHLTPGQTWCLWAQRWSPATVAIALRWLRSSKPFRQGSTWQAQRTICGDRPVVMWLWASI